MCIRDSYYSLGISAASFGKKISDYNLLTKEEIKKALPNLSISADKNPPKADDLYRNAKVPFAYNYCLLYTSCPATSCRAFSKKRAADPNGKDG